MSLGSIVLRKINEGRCEAPWNSKASDSIVKNIFHFFFPCMLCVLLAWQFTFARSFEFIAQHENPINTFIVDIKYLHHNSSVDFFSERVNSCLFSFCPVTFDVEPHNWKYWYFHLSVSLFIFSRSSLSSVRIDVYWLIIRMDCTSAGHQFWANIFAQTDVRNNGSQAATGSCNRRRGTCFIQHHSTLYASIMLGKKNHKYITCRQKPQYSGIPL